MPRRQNTTPARLRRARRLPHITLRNLGQSSGRKSQPGNRHSVQLGLGGSQYHDRIDCSNETIGMQDHFADRDRPANHFARDLAENLADVPQKLRGAAHLGCVRW